MRRNLVGIERDFGVAGEMTGFDGVVWVHAEYGDGDGELDACGALDSDNT